MHSTIVQPREEAARELVATLQEHGKRVGIRLAEIFEPLLKDDEELPDYVLLQQLMARSIRARLADLRAADEAYRAITEQIEEQIEEPPVPDGREPFLRARLAKTEAERREATREFDETYFGFSQMLEALYIMVGEEEIAEQLRPRVLSADDAQPQALLAEAEIPEVSESGEVEDQIQRRLLSRATRHPGMSRWLGIRIFRRRRALKR